MEKWAVFASHWKSRKLLFMLLTMCCWTEVLPKKVWETFCANPSLSSKAVLTCVILECFVNFLNNPYYKPLLWFMIEYIISIFILLLIVFLIPILFFNINNFLKFTRMIKKQSTNCLFANYYVGNCGCFQRIMYSLEVGKPLKILKLVCLCMHVAPHYNTTDYTHALYII